MELRPKRVKYRKSQRGKIKGNATRGNTVAFGDFGLQVLEHGWITERELEAARVAASHHLGGEGKMWLRVFPHKSVSKKPTEVRMGKGKGEIDRYVAVVKPGNILYEIGGVPEDAARTACCLQAHKLSVKCRFIKRRQHV